MHKDLLYGVRMLLKSPALTALAVLSLAIGIGANTAIFSVIDATLLHPVSYPEPDGLVMVWSQVPSLKLDEFASSVPDFVDWRRQARAFQSLGAAHIRGVNITGDGDPERVRAGRATAELFDALGASPMLGRTILPDDIRQASRAVVVSYGFWKRRLAADPRIAGKSITIDGAQHTVVGVMPQGSVFAGVDLWRPLTFQEEDWMKQRGSHNLIVLGRLKPGSSLSQARQEMSAIAQGIAGQHPDTNSGWGVKLTPIAEQLVRNVRPALLVLLGAVCLVLLIACANVANLLLARASGRRREMAIREALGAGSWRIVRLMLAESLALSTAAGIAGCLIAMWGVDGLVRLVPANLLPNAQSISVHGPVLAFAAGISLLCGLVFGIAPALACARQDVNDNLKEGSRGGTSGVTRRRVRALLAVSEIGLSLMLLIGAGLLLKSFWRLLAVDPGFRAGGVLAGVIVPPFPPDRIAERQNLYHQILDRVSSLPGVTRAAFGSSLPLQGGHNDYNSFEIGGRPRPQRMVDLPIADKRVVTPDYFAVMSIPLLKGRALGGSDTATTLPVAVIDESTVKQYWPNEDPVGKQIRYFKSAEKMDGWLTIVGVVGSVKHMSMEEPASATVYVPLEQTPYPALTFVLQSAGDPAALATPVRSAIRELKPDMPILGMRPLRRIVDDAMWRQRLAAQLVGLFALIAVALALVGAYGVILYSVSQRTNEFGIRMALGASRAAVLGLVFRESIALIGWGVAIGLAGAAACARLLSTLLYGVGATDPSTYAFAVALVTAAALAASYIPARRATRVDPIVALRYE
jgi:putative ABC transport system permease protein